EDRARILQSLVKHERQRIFVDGCLAALKKVDEISKKIETVRSLGADVAAEKAKEYAYETLSAHYPELADEDVRKELEEKLGSAFEDVKKLTEKAWETMQAARELDQDPALAANPTALLAAKRFLLLGAIFDETLGRARDLPALKALGPLFDVLDFYASAVKLLPEIAVKVQRMILQANQSTPGAQLLDV